MQKHAHTQKQCKNQTCKPYKQKQKHKKKQQKQTYSKATKSKNIQEIKKSETSQN